MKGMVKMSEVNVYRKQQKKVISHLRSLREWTAFASIDREKTLILIFDYGQNLFFPMFSINSQSVPLTTQLILCIQRSLFQ